MKTIEEMISVMRAYADGKKIELYDDVTSEWMTCAEPQWNWGWGDYRIKSEPKYRPYANEDECFADMMKHGMWVKGISEENRGYHSIFILRPGGVRILPIQQTYEKMLESFVWADDGSPCGVLEE